MQAACGIEENRVVAVVFRVLDRFLRGLDGVLRAALENGHVHALADDLQLLDGRRAVNIQRHEQRLFALLFQHPAELAAHGGFTGTLQAAEHENGRRRGAPCQAGDGAAHHPGQLFVDDFDDLLRRRQAFQHVQPYAAVGNLLDEILRHQEVDVRLQQRHAHFAHRRLHVRLAQLPAAGQLFQRVLQFLCKPFKRHPPLPPRAVNLVSAVWLPVYLRRKAPCQFRAALRIPAAIGQPAPAFLRT